MRADTSDQVRELNCHEPKVADCFPLSKPTNAQLANITNTTFVNLLYAAALETASLSLSSLDISMTLDNSITLLT